MILSRNKEQMFAVFEIAEKRFRASGRVARIT